jgi:hypothetical protein
MVKLNKNQRKFFEEAIHFFGEASRDIRLKKLNEFASDRGLIVPTSALKRYCQSGDLVRGHYDLTLVGIEPPEKNESNIGMNEEKAFETIEKPIIKDVSTFAKTSFSGKKTVRHFDTHGKTPKKWKNPVYLLLDSNYDVVSAHFTACGAYKKIWNVLHSYGDIQEDDAINEVEYTGKCIINSNNSAVWCVIITMEIEN